MHKIQNLTNTIASQDRTYAVAQFVRHGLKGPDGKLDQNHPDGVAKAIQFGKDLTPQDLILGYHSAITRAQQTTELIIENAPHHNKIDSIALPELQIPQFSPEMTKLYKQIASDPTRDGAEWYLSFGDNRPDEETFSPLETAERMAFGLVTGLEAISNQTPNQSIDAILGTHSCLPEPLLQRILVVNGQTGINNVNIMELGGILKLVEPVRFNITPNSETQANLTCTFRGTNYEIDMDRLNNLYTSYINK